MQKLQMKGRRTVSACLGDEARRGLGLNDYGTSLCLDKGADAKDREVRASVVMFTASTDPPCIVQTSRRFSYPTTQFPIFDKKDESEPVVINTVDDLLRHLEKIGRLQPTSSSVSDASQALSVTGSETEVDLCDASFDSISSVGSEDSVPEGEDKVIITEAPKGGT